jgi:hypothetical protein
MKDLGELNYYLGMKVTRTELDQHRYTLDILAIYNYLLQGHENKIFTTPIERDLKLNKFELDAMSDQHVDYIERFPYQTIVGALLYLSINIRSDRSYAVEVACKVVLRVLI